MPTGDGIQQKWILYLEQNLKSRSLAFLTKERKKLLSCFRAKIELYESVYIKTSFSSLSEIKFKASVMAVNLAVNTVVYGNNFACHTVFCI